jgi:hypothetical protein
MKMRRKAFWWLRFVLSGRFLEKFLNLRYDALVAKALDNKAFDNEAARSRPEIS